jgi:hypothetical protein
MALFKNESVEDLTLSKLAKFRNLEDISLNFLKDISADFVYLFVVYLAMLLRCRMTRR